MNDINAMFEIDFQSVLLGLVAFMAGFIALKKIFTEFCGWMGLETKFMRDRREQKEEVQYLKEHSKEQDKKIDGLVEGMKRLETSVEKVSHQVEELMKRNDEADRSKIGDRITQAYNFYRKKGQWTQMERWAFNNMVDSYKKAGGDSWIDEVALPVSKTWEIVDE